MDGRKAVSGVSRRKLLRITGALGAVSLFVGCTPTAPAPGRPESKASPATSGATSAPAAKAVEPVKIGLIIPLSGVLSEIGASMKVATDLAAEAVNAQGGLKALGGARIELLYGDSQGKPDVGVSETERLIQQGQVVALGGAWQSAVTIPTTQVAERLKTPYVNQVSGANSVTTRGFKYTFSIADTHDDHGRHMIEYLDYFAQTNNRKIARIAFLHEDTEYGQNTTKAGKKYGQEKGWEEVADVAYSASSPDLTAEVARVKAANPDVIFQASYLNDGILIARAMDKLDVAQQIVDGGGAIDLKFVKNLGPLAEGWAMSNQWNKDANVPGVKELNDRYKAKTGLDMVSDAAMFYQTILLFRAALEQAGRADRDAVRDALASINIGPGPDLIVTHERIQFDENGKSRYAVSVITEIHDGEHWTVWPANVASRKPVPRQAS